MDTIIFLAAVNCFNQYLTEDRSINPVGDLADMFRKAGEAKLTPYLICHLNNIRNVILVFANFGLPRALKTLERSDALVQSALHQSQLPRELQSVDLQ